MVGSLFFHQPRGTWRNWPMRLLLVGQIGPHAKGLTVTPMQAENMEALLHPLPTAASTFFFQ